MITIIGEGIWGKALGTLLEQNQNDFSFWNQSSKIENSNIIVLAVPTQAIREILENNKESLKKSVVINTSKGIEKDTIKLPFQITKEILGKKINYFSLIGPSFASEVAEKMPTMVNLGSFSKDENLNKEIKALFQTEYFKVKISASVEALELSGALKNIYAIPCGIAEGLGFMINTRANLIALAYTELHNLCQKVGFVMDKEVMGSIVGDLILTCSGLESRNFRFGKLLVKNSVSDCLRQINSTVEGFENALSVPKLSQKAGLNLPLANFVYQVINQDNPAELKSKFLEFIRSV